MPVAVSRRVAAVVDSDAGALKPPPWRRPATGPPKMPQIAAKAIPETTMRHGWREMVRASKSNIGRRSFGIHAVGQLCVEVRAPGVEADAESQDLKAHRTGG